MQWQEKLKTLENNKQWNEAIAFMKTVVLSNPNNTESYIYMNFLLMNLLVEEDYDTSKHSYYATLAKKYFDESYRKFSTDPEYLFYTGITAIMSEWYFDITQDDWRMMLQKAVQHEPNNIVYQWGYYSSLDLDIEVNKHIANSYAKRIMDIDPLIMIPLSKKGMLGEYILDCMKPWAQKVLDLYPYDKHDKCGT